MRGADRKRVRRLRDAGRLQRGPVARQLPAAALGAARADRRARAARRPLLAARPAGLPVRDWRPWCRSGDSIACCSGTRCRWRWWARSRAASSPTRGSPPSSSRACWWWRARFQRAAAPVPVAHRGGLARDPDRAPDPSRHLSAGRAERTRRGEWPSAADDSLQFPRMADDTARIGILTVSDRASRGVYEDKGGPAIRECLTECSPATWEPVARVIPDERERDRGRRSRSCASRRAAAWWSPPAAPARRSAT